MKRTLIALTLLLALNAGAGTYLTGTPATTNNDDSCDVAVLPAATLLLPYFEVDVDLPQSVARTTLFTVVNTTRFPQIAHVTIWTDWAYPVLDFNIFLTGYDVQAINLYDVIGGPMIIAPPRGTDIGTEPGERSLPNTANPNFAASAAINCNDLPGFIPASLAQDVRRALTVGTSSSCSQRVGTNHTLSGNAPAIGYVTIDLVNTCTVTLPTDEKYYREELLFDNVLTGDYQNISPNSATGNYAGGNPLVHIRAVPEGGAAGVVVPTTLPYTFYDRFTPKTNADTRAMDRRQPLPAVFSSRYIEGGRGGFNANLRVWREGVTADDAVCSAYNTNAGLAMKVTDVVRFDEHENPTTLAAGIILIPLPPTTIVLPATSSTPSSSPLFPLVSNAAGDVAGWLYLNLNNAGSTAYSAKRFTGMRPSQNWMTTSMSAEGRYEVLFDALMLANGCSTAPAITNGTTNPIGPGANATP